jgi:hypothetical protein
MARADAPRIVRVTVDLGDGLQNWDVQLTPEMKEYKKTFVMMRTSGSQNKSSAMAAGDMDVSISFNSGHEAVNWWLSDVAFVSADNTVSVRSIARTRTPSAWSVKRTGGVLQLTGPSDIPATVSLYDMRGKLVHRVSKPVGSARTVTLNNRRIPAGMYFVVVRNHVSGSELFRTRVTLMR